MRMDLGLGLSPTQLGGGAAGPYLPTGAVVVSGAAYNGVPAGNDTTGNGTAATPYATMVKALTVVAEGGTIVLNGDPGSPTAYPATTLYSITKGISIDAIWPYGAKLTAAAGQTRVLNINPTAGQSITTGRIIVDATGLTTGACVLINDQATTYSYTANGTMFQNWQGQAVTGGTTATATRVNVDLNGCAFSADTARSIVYFIGLTAGGVKVRNCLMTLTNQNTSGHGGIFVRARAVGVTGLCSNNVMNIGLDAGTTGTSFGIQFFNVVGSVTTRNILTITGPNTGRSFEAIQICAMSALPLDSSNAYVALNTINHNANGGMAIEIGEDNQDSGSRGFQNGAIVEFNKVYGSAISKAGSLHGIFNGAGANSLVRNNIVKDAAFSLLDKQGNGATFTCNLCIEPSQNFFRLKGSDNAKFIHNTCIALLGAPLQPVFITNNQTNSYAGSNSVVTGNIFYAEVSTIWVQKDATETGCVIDHNNYYCTTTLASNPFRWDGTNYANFAAWQAAVEASAISLNPQFINIPASNLDITPSNTGLDIVPTNALTPTDYLSRPFASPATTGAYQRQNA